MSTCNRCETVRKFTGDTQHRDGVGVCNRCGALACAEDGARDVSNQDFFCGQCIPSRLLSSSGLGPQGPTGGGGGGGGVPEGPGGGSGGGGTAVAFGSSGDFEERMPDLAAQSHEHRRWYRTHLRRLLGSIEERGRGEVAQALRTVRGTEWDPNRIAEVAALLADQVEAARDQQRLDESLLADAFGLAAWSVGVDPGAEPQSWQIRMLGDPRLQLAVGTAPIAATA